MKEVIFTVFPNDTDYMWQDFDSFDEAVKYGNEMFGDGNYIIESTI